jgi:hypothetical protein
VVVHTCNPSYSGGRALENCSSKPAQANSSRNPILKNPSPKKSGLVERLNVKVLSSSPSTAKMKEKKKKTQTGGFKK